MRTRLSAVLLAAVAVALPAVVHAACTNAEQQEVTQKTGAVTLYMTSNGYVSDGTKYDCASTKVTETYTIKCGAGYEYAIIAVGSQYAPDIDAWLKGPSGNLIDQDTKTDATPIVQVTAPIDMTLKYELRIYNSNYDDAGVTIMLFKKRIG